MRRSRWIRFASGLLAGFAIALGLNLFPYWLSYKAYRFDGYEVIGFPFTFREMGGLAGTYAFHTNLLLADLAIAAAFAAIAACAATWLPFILRRSDRGFPVTPR